MGNKLATLRFIRPEMSFGIDDKGWQPCSTKIQKGNRIKRKEKSRLIQKSSIIHDR